MAPRWSRSGPMVWSPWIESLAAFPVEPLTRRMRLPPWSASADSPGRRWWVGRKMTAALARHILASEPSRPGGASFRPTMSLICPGGTMTRVPGDAFGKIVTSRWWWC